jgi:hypothetical protein
MRNEKPGWCKPLKQCAGCVEIAATGISSQTHTCRASTPIGAALGLGACKDCEALRGDPCRGPSGRTRMPHVGRRRIG